MCASLQLLSMHGNHNMQLRRTSQTTQLWLTTPKLLPEDQTPLSSSRPQHPPCFACPISSPSSKAEPISRPTHRVLGPAPLLQFYIWNGSYLQSTPHAQSALSLLIHLSNSNPSTGQGWWLSSLRDRSGNSRATSGSSPASYSDIPWEFTLGGEETSRQTL